MSSISVKSHTIQTINGAGDKAQILRAELKLDQAMFTRPSSIAGKSAVLRISDGEFPSITFHMALKALPKHGVSLDSLKAIDFKGKLAPDLRKHIRNWVELNLGDGVKVRSQVSKKRSKKLACRDKVLKARANLLKALARE